MKKYLLLVLALLFIIGCGRNYFEPNPKSVSNPIYVTEALNSPIIYLTKDTATLKNGEVLPTHKVLPKGFVAIDKDIAKNGYILRVDNKNITYPKLIVTAKKRDNLLAILFGDNHFELYNLDTNKTIYIESKRQDGWVEGGKRSDGRGNVHERSCKFFTPGLLKALRQKSGITVENALPFWVIFQGNITRDPCRVREITCWYDGYPGHYFFWRDTTNPEDLLNHFIKYIKPLLD